LLFFSEYPLTTPALLFSREPRLTKLFSPLVCLFFERLSIQCRTDSDAPLSLVTAGGFFAVLAALEGNTSPQIKARMQEVRVESKWKPFTLSHLLLIQGFVPTLIQGYYVFVPAQLVNFGLVPPTHRFAFIGGVCLLWGKHDHCLSSRPQRIDDYLITRHLFELRQ
jgi:hypothetical protein